MTLCKMRSNQLSQIVPAGESEPESLAELPLPERVLSLHDALLARVIDLQSARWPREATEDPIWGLLRIVMAQQVSTGVACRLAARVKAAYPMLARHPAGIVPSVAALRAFGLPERRASCCVDILQKAERILSDVQSGRTWEEVLSDIKGVGPWTVSVFRIMVLRDPDVLPMGDIGLQRAVATVYGSDCNLGRLSDQWRPFRSVACWYLWKSLGNEQLG